VRKICSLDGDRPSCLVTDKTGAKIQKAFFEELMRELEAISPGVTANL
jgi:hypothetical protein